MQDIFGLIKTVLVWAILTFLFACIGFFTENPAIMVPLYGVLFLIALGIMYYFVSRKKVKTLEDRETPAYVFIIVSIIGLLLSLFAPALLMNIFRPGVFGYSIIIAFTILLLVLGFAGVYIINVLANRFLLLPNKQQAIIGSAGCLGGGYLLLIITSLLPAIAISGVDASFGTIGLVYFITLLDAVIAWETVEVVKRVLKK